MPVPPMPVKVLNLVVGETYLTRFEKITTRCRVMEVARSYGRVRAKVTPVDGHGTQWVEITRINGEMLPYRGTNRKKVQPSSNGGSDGRKKIRPENGRKG